MTENNTSGQMLALLPTGFVDLLGDDAAQEAGCIHALMELFMSYGYERIKPPMAEYEDSLLAPGPGASLAADMFRLMDPQSHKMLGIRSDITPQISRIARSRYEKNARPLRLAYANDVLRMRGGQDRFARQFCKVGAEIVGSSTHGDKLDAFIECAVLAVQGLHALGVQDISLDLALPRLVDQLFAEHKVKPDMAARLTDALDRRAEDGCADAPSSLRKVLIGLLDCNGDADEALAGLKRASLPKSSKGDVKGLGDVIVAIKAALADLDIEGVSITIDPLERQGFEYHNGIAFAVFSKGVRGELGRGGQYNVSFGHDDEPPESATGFTLYMDSVRGALPPLEKRDVLAVPCDVSWGDIRDLQEQGWIIVRSHEKDISKTATHRYKGGEIHKI